MRADRPFQAGEWPEVRLGGAWGQSLLVISVCGLICGPARVQIIQCFDDGHYLQIGQAYPAETLDKAVLGHAARGHAPISDALGGGLL